jgi:hypothetical protein
MQPETPTPAWHADVDRFAALSVDITKPGAVAEFDALRQRLKDTGVFNYKGEFATEAARTRYFQQVRQAEQQNGAFTGGWRNQVAKP